MDQYSSTKLKDTYMKYNYGIATLYLSGKSLSRVPDAVTELSEVDELRPLITII